LCIILQDTKNKEQLQQKNGKIKIIEERLRNEAGVNINLVFEITFILNTFTAIIFFQINNSSNNVGQTLKRELYNMISIEEETLKNLNKEEEKLKEHTIQYENKTQQWNNIIS